MDEQAMQEQPVDEAPRMTEEQAVQAIYKHAAELLHKGRSKVGVRAHLVEQGLSEEEAAAVVSDLGEMRAAAGRKNMLYGALWCAGGLAVTIATHAAATNGGTYVVAWGAVIFGAWQFIRGLALWMRA